VALSEGTDVAGFGLHPVLLDAALHLVARPGDDGEAGPLLPFAWTDTVVHATGATTARVRIAPATTGEGVSLLLADESGGLVATTASLVLRPLPAAAGGDTVAARALFELDWLPAETTAVAPDPGRWAVLGPHRHPALPGRRPTTMWPTCSPRSTPAPRCPSSSSAVPTARSRKVCRPTSAIGYPTWPRSRGR